jgi:uncharacterized protein YndB with AHSA1/START domain
MISSSFVYVTYIRATPEQVFDALRRPEFTRQYFFGATQSSDWKVGSAWKMFAPGDKLTDSGEVLEFDPPRKFVLKWRNEFVPEMMAEGYTRCAFDIVPQDGGVTQLKVTHEMEGVENSKTIAGVSRGWPKILAGLKTLLETGRPMEGSDQAKVNREKAAAAG